MRILASPKNAIIAVLSVAVIGLSAALFTSHPAAAPVATTDTAASLAGWSGHHSRGADLQKIFGFLTRDTGLSQQQILADIKAGETLDQIAGSNASKVESDAVAEVQTALDQAVAKGAITSSDETRLLNDAKDAIDVLMTAKLSALKS